MSSIPWDKLGIPAQLREACAPEAPAQLRNAVARMALPAAPEAMLAALTVLLADPDAGVRDTATQSLRGFPNAVEALSQRTHAKVLEALANLREDRALDERLLFLRNTNDATARRIAARADTQLCNQICDNHERLLITPDLVVTLHQNAACPPDALERAVGFLRMNECMPEPWPPVGSTREAAPVRAVEAPAPAAFDLEAEIEAALSGKASPMLEERKRLELFDLSRFGAAGSLQGFALDFRDEDDFGLDLIGDDDDEVNEQAKLTLERKIAQMPVGKKIKLAYLGNKEARAILIRDRNKQVSMAVIKGGRMGDNEALSFAGNRSLSSEVLREIANNREWMRKYPIKVALANNPKTPASVAVGLVTALQTKDLAMLARNKNVSSVVFTMAGKLAKQRQNS